MRIHTKTVWDMATLEIIEDECFEWIGPLDLCKGDGTAKDQLALNNKNVADQLAQQKAIRDKIMAATDKYTTGSGEGYDPAQFSAMISQFLNQNSANYNQAGQSVMSSLASRGAGTGQLPVGGDYTRGLEDLQAAKATGQSQGILGANISNLQQSINNRFNALNVQSGQSAQVGGNVNTFSTGANNSLDQYVKAANTGFSNAFTTGFGSTLGKAFGAGIGGAVSNAASMIPGVTAG